MACKRTMEVREQPWIRCGNRYDTDFDTSQEAVRSPTDPEHWLLKAGYRHAALPDRISTSQKWRPSNHWSHSRDKLVLPRALPRQGFIARAGSSNVEMPTRIQELKPISANPPRWKPSADPASITVAGLDTAASVNDQIDQIDQLITLKLQVTSP